MPLEWRSERCQSWRIKCRCVIDGMNGKITGYDGIFHKIKNKMIASDRKNNNERKLAYLRVVPSSSGKDFCSMAF